MPTLKLLFISVFAISVLAPAAHAHGVERGSIYESLIGDGMSEELNREVRSTLRNRCNLLGAKALSATNRTREESVDQGVADRFHLLRIIVEKDGMEEVILLRLAEYAFSNPAIANQEVLSLESSLCR